MHNLNYNIANFSVTDLQFNLHDIHFFFHSIINIEL